MLTVFEGWTVLNKGGQIVRYEFGYGLQDVVLPSKRKAYEQARLLAEREDELASGKCWEHGDMPYAQVWRMGYRVVKASVSVRVQRKVDKKQARAAP